MKPAMITIEVLISLLILFLVVATSVTTLKNVTMIDQKKEKYQDFYRALFSVQDFLDATICRNSSESQGKLYGFEYDAKCIKIKEQRSYKKTFDIGDKEGNFGNKLFTLYKVHLLLKKKQTQKEYVYYKTIIKKVL